jgi:hypothetical protein
MLLFSFLGEQPMPALLPLWALEQIDATCLIPSERTEGLAQILSEFIIKDRDLSRIHVFPYFKISAYDLRRAEGTLHKMIRQIQPSYSGSIAFNLTGGTKIMSMSGLLAAFEKNYEMFYVISEAEEIISLSPEDSTRQVLPLNIKISVEQYFAAHGIDTSLDQSFANPDEETYHPPKVGDALEELVFQKAVESGYFDDVQKGLFIRKEARIEQPMIRELDVVVIRNGRLAVCSCKSGKYSPEYLAELEALTAREKFGIYCGKVFVSGKESFSEYRQEEFRQEGVSLVFGKGLQYIDDILLMATEA